MWVLGANLPPPPYAPIPRAWNIGSFFAWQTCSITAVSAEFEGRWKVLDLDGVVAGCNPRFFFHSCQNLRGQLPPTLPNPTALLETYCEKTFVLWHNRSSFRDSWISFSRQHHSDRASTLLSSTQCSERWECARFGSRPNGIKRLGLTVLLMRIMGKS